MNLVFPFLLLMWTGGDSMPEAGSSPSEAPPGPGEGAAGSGEVIRDVYRSPHGERAYRLYLPPGKASGDRPPLVVVLHGCTQDAEDFARGTRMDDLAGERGAAVLYPEQSEAAHPMRCWNWYEPRHQARDAGEPAILAGMIHEVTQDRGLDGGRVFIAGISAGGAMAAVLVAAYPTLARAVASHSGVPFGAARSLAEATGILTGDARISRDALVRAVLDAMDRERRLVPLLVIHGDDDPVVSPRNADWFESQWEGLIEAVSGHEAVRESKRPSAEAGWEGRKIQLEDRDGRRWFEARRVGGLGHAWSGGSPEGTFTQPDGLDASRLVLDFFLGGTERAGPDKGAHGGAVR